MAVSSTSSSAVSSGLDVAAIVTGLMTVERQPVDKVEAKIADVTSQISALGSLKSKASALQTAVANLENPGLFSQKTASSSNASALTASVTSAAATGNYNIQVAQTAAGSKLAYSGISATTSLMDLSAFSIQVAGGTTYNSETATFDSDDVAFGRGDTLTFAVNGGDSQSYTLTQTYSDLDDLVAAINTAVDDGDLSDVMATNVDGVLVISTTNPLQGITSASYLSANLAAVTTTQGSADPAQTEAASVVFSDMVAGQRVSLNGLTFTASAAVTAAAVAGIFDGLGATAVTAEDRMIGLQSAAFDGADMAYAEGDALTFTLAGSDQTFTLSQTYSELDDLVAAINTAVDDGDLSDVMATNVDGVLVISSTDPTQGITAASYISANLAEVTTTQGSADPAQTEAASVMFSGMVAGQRVSLNGLTFTASAAVSAEKVASIFDGLGATGVGAATRMAELESDDFETEFGGTLSGSWSANTWSAALTAPGSDTATFTSLVSDTNVDDLTSRVSADATVSFASEFGGTLTGSWSADSWSVVLTASGASSATFTSLLPSTNVTDLSSRIAADATVSTDNVASNVSAADFKTYLNSLDIGVVASLVTQSSGNQVLTISTAETGAEQTLEVSGVATQVGGLTASTLESARDAFVAVNGLIVQRSSNVIDDVVTGLTINLLAPVGPADLPAGDVSASNIADYLTAFDGLSTVVISVANTASDNSDTRIREFVTAYNELIADYKDQTKRSATATERGVLVNDTFLTSYMGRIRDLYGHGIRLADGSTVSMADFGVDLQLDGTMLIDELVLSDAISNGLQSKLAAGVVVGPESALDGAMTLNSFLRASLRTTGILTQHINDYEDRQVVLETKRTELEDRMSRVQARLYTQYSALDALLMRMQVTSNALASAIDSLTANQTNN